MASSKLIDMLNVDELDADLSPVLSSDGGDSSIEDGALEGEVASILAGRVAGEGEDSSSAASLAPRASKRARKQKRKRQRKKARAQAARAEREAREESARVCELPAVDHLLGNLRIIGHPVLKSLADTANRPLDRPDKRLVSSIGTARSLSFNAEKGRSVTTGTQLAKDLGLKDCISFLLLPPLTFHSGRGHGMGVRFGLVWA